MVQLEILQIAMYLFFIIFILIVATKVLWLVFFLFNFRVWESVLTYDFLSQYIQFSHVRDYYILIVIISAVTYGLVLLATKDVPILRYIFLVVMAIYTIRIHDIADILIFKDLLEAAGWWDLNYWKDQFSELLHFSIDDFQAKIADIWNSFWGGLTRFFGYIKGE